MDPEPDARGQSRDGDEEAARPTAGRAQAERYGPLALKRYAKDDGRALVLYAHAEDDRE